MPHTTPPPQPPQPPLSPLDEFAQQQGDRAAASSPAATPDGKPPARYPAQAVPGITALWQHTLGNADIVIGVVDGPPDTSHPCLTGANLETREPWWLPPTPASNELIEHGTFTASVLAGRHGTVLPGLAPGCHLIALGQRADEHVSHDPHSAARAIEELLQAGAHIIQYTPAHSTASADADPMLKRAIAQAIDAGVLICAPAGNDYGRNDLAPAILPGVLAVGAHRADEAMFLFSNHGPAYHGHGITALGEAVLGAVPGGGVKAQKGTCVSVALVTGAAALLVSMQRHLGHAPDPLAVRDALLATARPCTPDQAHGEPVRCLNGYLDLPAAAAHLFPGLPPLTHPTAPTNASAPTATFDIRPLRRRDRPTTA
ncbi:MULTISPECIES: S8 family serine peptidase [unclassified Nonomuraea]|uniref:S8 family serine peptidase n=1 Tax=unclassified Nonomuraea TaxID=2593643 RepID=UPI0033F591C8